MNKQYLGVLRDFAGFVVILFIAILFIGYVVLDEGDLFNFIGAMCEGAVMTLILGYGAVLPAFLVKIKPEGLVALFTLVPWDEIDEISLAGDSKYTFRLLVSSKGEVETIWMYVFEDPNVFLELFCSRIDWLDQMKCEDAPRKTQKDN